MGRPRLAMMDDMPSNPREALDLRMTRYFTGIPCGYGHLAPRYTSSRECVRCASERRSKRKKVEVEKTREWNRISYHRHKDRRRATKYGVNRMPPETCECCGRRPSGVRPTLHLDHDHTTGKFRGWICHSCNVAIGHLGDSIDGVQKALAYLTKVADNSDYIAA